MLLLWVSRERDPYLEIIAEFDDSYPDFSEVVGHFSHELLLDRCFFHSAHLIKIDVPN